MIMDIREIIIAGITVALTPVQRSELKGLNIDTTTRFSFYHGTFNGQPFCFASQNGTATLTPANYRRYAERVETIVGVPVVFILEAATYINRSRLIEQGVYFVVSRKYAFLPTLLVNAIEKSRRPKKKQTSVTGGAVSFAVLSAIIASWKLHHKGF